MIRYHLSANDILGKRLAFSAIYNSTDQGFALSRLGDER